MISFKEYLQEAFGGLEVHTELNPKLWENSQHLKQEVRHKLLDFANKWLEFSKIPHEVIQDIIMTGGNASFLYTDISDIDVHIVGRKSDIPIPQPYLDDYLMDKKHLWQMTHKINVLGYAVEPYFQDISEGYHNFQGAYSLMRDSWVQQPTYRHFDYDNNPTLKSKVDTYKSMIDKMITTEGSKELLRNLKDQINYARSDVNSGEGEFAIGNLVFKSLRNEGYLDKIDKYVKPLEDKELSL